MKLFIKKYWHYSLLIAAAACLAGYAYCTFQLLKTLHNG